MAGEKKVSRITIPEHAHPFARLTFQLMKEHCVSYQELEFRSGILGTTVKEWRVSKTPSLQSIQATLGSFGYALVPVPPLASLKPETLEKLEEISLDFVSDNEALAAAMALACKVPVGLPATPAANVEVKFETKPVRRLKVIEGQAALDLAS